MYGFRARMNLTVDFRTQSDYGTIRAYAAIIGQQQTNDGSGTGTAGILRAFIQFAGFTVGHAVSYFDFINGADYGYIPNINAALGGTGVNGIDLIAYTWQIGNGFSASVDIEDKNSSAGGRGSVVVNASSTNIAIPPDSTLRFRLSLPGHLRVIHFRETCLIWWLTFASIRPGARLRSWAPSTTPPPATTRTSPA